MNQNVDHYYHIQLRSAIGYVMPADKLVGREAEIFKERNRKLEVTREERKQRRQAARVGEESDLDNPPWLS